MLNTIKILIMLSFVMLFASCYENINDPDQKIITYTDFDIEKYNELSTFVHLDSINKKPNSITVFLTDTSKFYQPQRLIQSYSLTFLTAINYQKMKSNIDSVSFKVHMPFRSDGDIIQTFSNKDFFSLVDRYNIPEVKYKILRLNKFNRTDFMESRGTKEMDAIYSLNMYFAQFVEPDSWVGVDSYGIIWEYEYNKERAYDLTSHVDVFNKILTDTLYMSNRNIGNKIHQILIK